MDLTFAFGDIAFALDERVDASLSAWAKERARAIAQSPRVRRRLDSRNRRRQLEQLAHEHEQAPNVFVRRPQLGVEQDSDQWALEGFELPRTASAVVDRLLVERGLLACIIFASLRLAKKFGSCVPASLLGAVAPERKWRLVIKKQKAKPADKPPQRPASARLLIALLRFVLGFFGSHKVDARNTP